MNPFERGSTRHPAQSELGQVQNETSRLVAESHYQEARVTELLPLLRKEERLKTSFQLQETKLQAAQTSSESRSEMQRLQEKLRVLRGGQPENSLTAMDPALTKARAEFEAAKEELDAVRVQIRELDLALRQRFGLS